MVGRPWSRLAPLLVVGALLGACSGGDDAPQDPDAGPSAPASACADGFSDAERGYCVEIAPSDACAPGTRPRIGEAACVPVGWTSACPPGTVADPSGWGCVDVPAPAAACTGATRMSVTSAGCVPVGDCGAAFPPAGALVVNASFTPDQLDATHFKAIGDAVTAATSGATIAIDAGTYVEALIINKSLDLVGRCAAEVVMKPPTVTASGIVTQFGPTIAVRGITFSGFAGGILVYGGAKATIEDVVVEGSVRTNIEVDQSKATVRRSKLVDPVGDPAKGRAWGISAGGVSEVLAEDVTITGGTNGLFVATAGTKVTLRSSIVSGQKPPPLGRSNRSCGASALEGAEIAIDKSVFRDIVADEALLADGATLSATETVVHGVRVAGGAARGHGISALNGGHIKLASSAILEAESVGVFGKDAGSTFELRDSVVRGPPSSAAVPDASFQVTSERSGIGLELTTGSSAALTGTAIVDAWAYGAYVDATSALDLKTSLIDHTRPIAATLTSPLSIGMGLASAGGAVTLDDVAVTRSVLGGISVAHNGTVKGSHVIVRDVSEGKPSVSAGGLQAGLGGIIELDGSAVSHIASLGVVAYRDATSSVSLTRSTVHDVVAVDDQYGHGIMVLEGARVTLHGSAVFDNDVIGLAVSDGRAFVTGSTIANNAIGLQAQDGSFVVESADDQADLGDGEVRVSPDSAFVGNTVKVGSQVLPLPAPLLP